MSTTQEYRIRLDAAQADLTAVTLAGSGTLAAPGNAAKAALQSLLTMINGLDEVITRAWNEQAIQNLLVVDAAKWSAEHSQEFASPERLAVRQDDYLSGRRDELVLDAVIALARVQHTRMMGPRNAAESAMIAFTAAVIAFAGDPAELAIGRAALTALDNVAGA
ncbi:MAG: hypothetical protein HY898_02280, partial [Deltaproteobacteria bacterium]|nr:hypothetical protein [Deltaproteobacteria bacterium]